MMLRETPVLYRTGNQAITTLLRETGAIDFQRARKATPPACMTSHIQDAHPCIQQAIDQPGEEQFTFVFRGRIVRSFQVFRLSDAGVLPQVIHFDPSYR